MKTLKLGDHVIIYGDNFLVLKEKYDGFFYLKSFVGDNDKIFNRLGIDDKVLFSQNILGYRQLSFNADGVFPFCRTLEDLTKLVEALINYKNMEELPDLSTEFIVDCTDNTKEEQLEVYKWLVETRGYGAAYLDINALNYHSVVACNKKDGNSYAGGLLYAKKIYPNYKVYTFEQFKKAIDMEKERKIIGYKAPFDMHKGVIKKGEIFRKKIVDGEYYYRHDYFFVPNEIVETWEPVYEEISKDKVFTLRCWNGDFELKVTPNGIFYEPENTILSSELLSKIISPLMVKDGSYTYKAVLTHVDLWCKQRVPAVDIKAVLDYYEKIKKQ